MLLIWKKRQLAQGYPTAWFGLQAPFAKSVIIAKDAWHFANINGGHQTQLQPKGPAPMPNKQKGRAIKVLVQN